MLGHGNVEDVKAPRLVRALSTRVVLSVSCGVHHTAAIVAVSGVSAFVGYDNQPFRKKAVMGRWGDLKVNPVHKYAISIRRLSRTSRGSGPSTRRSGVITTARTRASHVTGGVADSRRTTPRSIGAPSDQQAGPSSGAIVSARPPSSSRSRQSRTRVPGVPIDIPSGTATYLKSAKRPSTHRSYKSDQNRRLTDLPIVEQPSVISVDGESVPASTRSGKSAPQVATPTSASVTGSGPLHGRFRMLSQMTRERLESDHKSAKAGKVRATSARQNLLKRRGLPPLNNRVVPGMPAGELFTWGTGVFGQVSHGHLLLCWDCRRG